MNEYMYKAFIKELGLMCEVGALYYGKYYNLEGISCHIPNGYVVTHSPEDIALLNYMNLKDKNGKCYCQDDLVMYDGKVHRLIKSEHKFELEDFYRSYQDNPSDFFSEYSYLNGEIVGNVWENPELLWRGQNDRRNFA